MKNLNHKIYFAVVTCFAVFVFSSSGYANPYDVKVGCSKGFGEPTIEMVPGRKGVILSAQSSHLEVKEQGGNIVKIYALDGDPGYQEWFEGLRQRARNKEVGRIEVKKLLGYALTNVDLDASCSDGSNTVEMTPFGVKKITCGKGQGIIFKLNDPECETDANKTVVVTVTERGKKVKSGKRITAPVLNSNRIKVRAMESDPYSGFVQPSIPSIPFVNPYSGFTSDFGGRKVISMD